MKESLVEQALAAHLADAAARADAARAAARRSLSRAARQAAAAGWSQRRIGQALGRSQPEVLRLLRQEAPPASETPPPGVLDLVLDLRRDAIVDAAARHGASNVRIFGSVARRGDGPDSDVDLIVDLAPDAGLFALGALQVELEAILGRPVDVVPSDSLKPAVREGLEAIAL